MSRVFFPTYSLNRFGVRDTGQSATLGAVQRFDSEPNIRASNNPTGPMLGAIRAIVGDGPLYDPIIRVGPVTYNPGWLPPSPGPAPQPQPIVVGPISSSGGGGSVPTPPVAPPVTPPPVSTQVLPTPTVTVPPPAPTSILLVSSGGGTQTPSTPSTVAPPIVYATDANGNIINAATGAILLTAPQAASMGTSAATLNAGATAAAAPSTTSSLVGNIAAWLGGSTSLFNYNVPNALLAGVVVLGFAWLSSSGSKKR